MPAKSPMRDGELIAAVDAGQGLAFDGQTHVRGFGNHKCDSTIRQSPRPPPRLGNIYFESTRGFLGGLGLVLRLVDWWLL